MTSYDLSKFQAALSYDPETGSLTWRRGSREGSEAGYITRRGYRQVTVSGQEVMAHRVAWALAFGRWPDRQIDHRNGDRSDNRLSNLRECDAAENAQNTPAASLRGLPKGVHKHSIGRGYNARIGIEGKQQYLGYFETVDEAHQAYLEAKKQIHTFQPVPRD